jgi:hypothetical protein
LEEGAESREQRAEGIKSEAKIDNFTLNFIKIWKILPIFASYRVALWKKTLACLKS